MDNERKFCRKCLLADMSDQRPLYELIQEYIASLDEAMRVCDRVYHERLAVCRSCSMLIAGTCVKCGCYAEARAAKKMQACPDVPPKWTADDS